MPEDPIAQNEIAALTRRFDEMEQRLTNLIQANGIQLAMTFGQQLADTRSELKQHIDHRNAELIEALSKNVGKNPNAE